MCQLGNVPASTLHIEDYCRMLIDVVGKGGGLIVAPRSSIDEARPEDIKRMVEFSREYGRYS